MTKGTIFIVSAPSGTGKSSLIKALIQTHHLDNVQVSISYTTRAMRPGETNGKHYFFVSVEKFKSMIDEHAFLEHACVYGNYYGTSVEVIEQVLSTGADIFLDIDWQGTQQIRNSCPQARSIFILPPSRDALDRRLRSRGKDSEEIISSRMSHAISEMTHYVTYDYLIINDNFDAALLELKSIIMAEKLRMKNQELRYNTLINNLLAD